MSIQEFDAIEWCTHIPALRYCELLATDFSAEILNRQLERMGWVNGKVSDSSIADIQTHLSFTQERMKWFLIAEKLGAMQSVTEFCNLGGWLHKDRVERLRKEKQFAVDELGVYISTAHEFAYISSLLDESDLPPFTDDVPTGVYTWALLMDEELPPIPRRDVSLDDHTVAKNLIEFLELFNSACAMCGVVNSFRQSQPSTALTPFSAPTHSNPINFNCTKTEFALLFKLLENLGLIRASDKELTEHFAVSGKPITESQLRTARGELSGSKPKRTMSKGTEILLESVVRGVVDIIGTCNDKELKELLHTISDIRTVRRGRSNK